MRTLRTHFQRFSGTVVLASCIALLGACSDGGGTPIPEVTPSLTKPSIDSFEITSAVNEKNTSESGILVPSGQGVTLTWRTSNAETVELSSASGTIEDSKVEAAGSKEIASVTQDDEFILVAKAGGVETRKTVTVTMTAPKPTASVVSFTAKPTSMTVGETTQLCFEVKPSDATVAIVDIETGDEIALEEGIPYGDDMIEDEEAEEEEAPSEDSAISAMTKLSIAAATVAPDEEGGTVTPELDPTPTPEEDEPPAVVSEDTDSKTGCSMPLPLAMGEHGFELTVTDSEGNTATAKTIVTVEQAVRVVEFTVNGGPSTTVNVGDPISFAYTVDPVDATVTIEPGFGPVTVDANGKGTVTSKAETPGSTTYTLTATDATGTATDAKTVTVTVSQGSAVTAPKLTVSTKAVFAGESVTFTVSDVAQGMTVSLKHPDGKTTTMEMPPMILPLPPPPEPTSWSKTISVTVGGAYQVVGAINNAEVYSNAETIDVRAWGNAKGGTDSWNTVAISSGGDTLMAGASSAAAVGTHGVNDDWRKNPVIGSDEKITDITKVFASLSHVPADRQGPLGPFPVNALAFDTAKDQGKRVYAGLGGGVLVSKDGGAHWSALDHMLIWRGYYDAPATVCKGMKREVGKIAGTDLIGVLHVCDVVVDPQSDRLYVAVEDGVIYLDNVDAAIANATKENPAVPQWKGSVEGSTLYNTIVHDLDLAGGTLYAATAKGMYVSTQGGAEDSWTAFGGGVVEGKDVYAVAADVTNNRVYAGTVDGSIAVRSTTGDGAGWTSKQSVGAPVYSLSVDYATGDVLAGTGAGVFISRDQGETWTDISASMDTKVVYGVALQSGVFAAATDKGVYISRPGKTVEAPVVDDEPVIDEPVVEGEPTVAPPTGSASDTNASML